MEEAVLVPDGISLEAPVAPPRGQESEESACWVTEVFDDFSSPIQTPVPIVAFMAGSGAVAMGWEVFTTLCNPVWSEAEQFPYQTVMQLVRMLSMVQLSMVQR